MHSPLFYRNFAHQYTLFLVRTDKTMKKLLVLLSIIVCSLPAVADDYTQLVFKNSDGTLSSITSMGLTITFDNGQMVAVNGDESLTIETGDLQIMYFSSVSSTVTGGMGDANNDGVVNVTDIILTVNYIIGQTPSIFYRDHVDINGDGVISITDVTYILNIITGQ